MQYSYEALTANTTIHSVVIIMICFEG